MYKLIALVGKLRRVTATIILELMYILPFQVFPNPILFLNPVSEQRHVAMVGYTNLKREMVRLRVNNWPS